MHELYKRGNELEKKLNILPFDKKGAYIHSVDNLTLTGVVYFLAFISVEALPRGTASRQCPEGRRLTQA